MKPTRPTTAACLLVTVLFAVCAVVALATPRSGRWPSVRAAYLAAHPTCEACGATDDLVVHHVKPVHEYPALELEPANLITLCPRCHITFGHLGNYRAWNPCAREDASRHLAEVKDRPMTRESATAFEKQFGGVYQTAP